MDKKKYRKNSSGWIVLLIVAFIVLVSAIIYKISIENNEDNNENENLNSNNVVTEEKELVVNFDDFMIPKTNIKSSDLYYEAPAVKGLYLTGNSAGNSKFDELIELANETEINAFVIDVKNDSGKITFDMDLPIVDEIGAENNAIKDIDGLMDKLYDNNIYPIARIVAFKDPYLSSKKTDYAIKNKDGSLFYYHNVSWLNPYNKDAWKYIVDVSKEAIKAGFKEIQYDYIRFEATYRLADADFGEIDETKTRMDVIVDFLDYVNEELADYDVKVSADVFGTIITSEVDAKMIGQDYVEMSKRLDVICPMVYPSHYGRGYYGLPASESPDFHPYVIIKGAMDDSNKRLSEIEDPKDRPIVRPWLQSFTASYLGTGNYMVYDANAIRDQINAAYDAGLSEWLLWNAGNTYNPDSLLNKEEINEDNMINIDKDKL